MKLEAPLIPPMSSAWTNSRAGVHWWTVLTAILTFVLLCSGGLVTSHGAGMAVPRLAEQLWIQHVSVSNLAVGRRNLL